MKPGIVWLLTGIALLCLMHGSEEMTAQTIFESSSGESSILLKDGGVGLINFADKSIKLNYAWSVRSENDLFIGAKAEAAAKDNLLELFRDTAFTLGKYSLSVYATKECDIGWNPLLFKHFVIGLSAGVEASKSKLLPFVAGDTRKWFDTVFVGPVIGGYLTLKRNSLGDAGHFFALGFGVRCGMRTNAKLLDERQVCELLRSDTANHTSVSNCVQALDGIFLAGKGLTGDRNVTISADAVWGIGWLDNRVNLSLLYRYDGLYSADRSTWGGGVFIARDSTPLSYLGGITFESVRGHFVIALQTGYSF